MPAPALLRGFGPAPGPLASPHQLHSASTLSCVVTLVMPSPLRLPEMLFLFPWPPVRPGLLLPGSPIRIPRWLPVIVLPSTFTPVSVVGPLGGSSRALIV